MQCDTYHMTYEVAGTVHETDMYPTVLYKVVVKTVLNRNQHDLQLYLDHNYPRSFIHFSNDICIRSDTPLWYSLILYVLMTM